MTHPATRRPRSVYDAGEEPDPRFSLANERTFLAWVRTALALMAGSVALHSLGVPASGPLRDALVVALAVAAATTTALAYRRWALVERALRERAALPAFGLGLALTVGLVSVSLLLALVLVVD